MTHRRMLQGARTHLAEEFISTILVLEPIIRQDLFAWVLRRQPYCLRHSALHEARTIALLDIQSQVHGRRVHVLEREQPRHSMGIIARDYPRVRFFFRRHTVPLSPFAIR